MKKCIFPNYFFVMFLFFQFLVLFFIPSHIGAYQQKRHRNPSAPAPLLYTVSISAYQPVDCSKRCFHKCFFHIFLKNAPLRYLDKDNFNIFIFCLPQGIKVPRQYRTNDIAQKDIPKSFDFGISELYLVLLRSTPTIEIEPDNRCSPFEQFAQQALRSARCF